MIVNLPTWGNIASSSEPWVSGALNSFMPAAYFEIGIASGIFIILLILGLVTGALQSLLNSLGGVINPMRGIPNGNSRFDQIRNRNNFGGHGTNFRTSGVGSINTRVATYRGSGRGWGYRLKKDTEPKVVESKKVNSNNEYNPQHGPAYKVWKEPE